MGMGCDVEVHNLFSGLIQHYSSRACQGLRRLGSTRALCLIYGSKCLVLEEDKDKVLQGCLQVAWLGKPVLCCMKSRLYPAAEHGTTQPGRSELLMCERTSSRESM